jgi:hypothetical protein
VADLSQGCPAHCPATLVRPPALGDLDAAQLEVKMADAILGISC